MDSLDELNLTGDIDVLLEGGGDILAEPNPERAPSPPEQTNLAEDISDEELTKIGYEVFEAYEEDLKSRSEWEEQHERWINLFYQKTPLDSPPWEGSSEECVPIFTEAINQFQSRSYKAFFGNRYFVQAIPVGQSTQQARERGERVAHHMNFQLGVLDRTYKWNKNQMFMACALHGSDFTKTYFSQLKRRTVIDRVRAIDLVVPYHSGPVRLEDLERKTEIKFCSVNETKILNKMGFYIDQAQPYSGFSEDDRPTASSLQSLQGIDPSTHSKYKSGTALILEQHCFMDLDEDGINEPYIVWIDAQTKKVLRIQIRYEVDELGAPLRDKEPLEYYTHYQFLPNPDGFYGLGFGHLVGDLSIAGTKILRTFIDAMELGVKGNNTFILSDNLGIKGDDFEVELGRANKIPRNVEDINRSLVKLTFAGAQQEQIQGLNLIREMAQRITSSSDVLAGQPDKVYQPTALLAMMEQGLQLYSSVQEFLGYSMEDELGKVYRLNAKYMVSEEYYFDGDEQLSVTPEDYKDDFRIVPIFDPRYSTRSQKLAKAQAVYETTLSNPIMSQDQDSVYISTRQYLQALDVENIDEILKKPEAPEVARIDDQNLENAYFLMPSDKRPLFDVFPDQDHLRHIQLIDKFITFLDGSSALNIPNVSGGDPGLSRLMAEMSGEQKKEIVANLLRHRSIHLAYMHGLMNGAMDETGRPASQSAPQEPANANTEQAGFLSKILESFR